MTVAAAPPKAALKEYLERLKAAGVKDVSGIGELCAKVTAKLGGSSKDRQAFYECGAVARKWYASLSSGKPDYSVYHDPRFLAELWGCWVVYSRKYVLSLLPPRNFPPSGIASYMQPVRRVVDLGCGCGYTTAALSDLFRRADIFGTNIAGSVQYEVARQMAKSHRFTMVPDIKMIPFGVDLVFASEYFEHILAPISHLREVVRTLRPRFLLIANAFGTIATGHFHKYYVDGEYIPGDKTSRVFNAELKKLGYVKVKTKLWNNRPGLWRKGTAGDS